MALGRTIVYALSIIYTIFTPLFIVYLYPQMAIDEVLKWVFLSYRYFILFGGIVAFVNVMWFAPQIIGKLGGLNIESKNTNKVMDSLLGKYKKLFRR